MVDMNREYSKG